MCLHECLEQFNLFGFTTTRTRLRDMVGASGRGWTEAQLLEAMNHLAGARKSWIAYLHQAEERRGIQKPAVPALDRPPKWGWHNEWLETYLTDETARRWLVADLGECVECGHHLIHHGTWACRACSASPLVVWDARCRVGLPSPAHRAD